MGKWIDFEALHSDPGRKTQRWDVVSKKSGGLLGTIYWWGAWRQYVFEPSGESRIIFEEDCLRDIAAFCEEKTREHKANRNAKEVHP